MMDKAYWVWLHLIPEVGAGRFHLLLKRFGDPKEVYEATDEEIRSTEKLIGAKAMHGILASRRECDLVAAEKVCRSEEFSVLTIRDADYPPLLRMIPVPPVVLFLKGSFPDPKKPALAIVGSRHSTVYGCEAARKLAGEMADLGIAVISGLARGIDGMAHRGALEHNGYTLGVLGCGVDIVYPRENEELFRQMAKKGGIVSEYPPGMQPLPGFFPVRNRIISGISDGVLVVEAGRKSGALITVDHALEQGREVFALPGNIDSPVSEGTNHIIQQGAHMVTCARDIVEVMGWGIHGKKAEKPPEKPIVPQLDFFEMQVYNALADGKKYYDEVLYLTEMEPGRLNTVLSMMEIKGIIRQLPGQLFIREY